MIEKIWNKKLRGIPSTFLIGISIIFDKINSSITTALFTSNLKYSGKKIKVMKGVSYRYPGNIEVHNEVIIGKHTSLTSEGLNTHYLVLEDGVSIGSNCNIDFTGGIIIKKNAHIAHDVLISTHDHGFDYKSKPKGKHLEIGEYAFIGSKSIIMHNCNYIGKNAIVGTASVVTKNIPDYAIVAGNPASVIKYVNK